MAEGVVVMGLGLLQVQGSNRCQLSVLLIELKATVPVSEPGRWRRGRAGSNGQACLPLCRYREAE